MGFFKKAVKSVNKAFSGPVGSVIGNPGSKNAFGTNALIGEALNDITGLSSQMDKSYKQQIDAMNLQNSYNQTMWNLQNEYNSPISQLARMREAGININPTSYALGTGNLSNTASSVSSENGFAGSGTPAGNPISMLMGMAEGIQGIRASQQNVRESAQRILTQAQGREESVQRVKNMNATLSNIVTQGRILKEQKDLTRINTQIALHNLSYAMKHHKPTGFAPTYYSDPASAFIDNASAFGSWFHDKFLE